MEDQLIGTTVKVFKSHIRYGKRQCGNFSMYVRKLIDQDIVRKEVLEVAKLEVLEEVEVKTDIKKEPLKWVFPISNS